MLYFMGKWANKYYLFNKYIKYLIISYKLIISKGLYTIFVSLTEKTILEILDILYKSYY